MNTLRQPVTRNVGTLLVLQLLAVSILVLGMTVSGAARAASVTLNVDDGSGTPVSGFRYLVEEDTTFHTVPGVHTTDTLSLDFHASHTPVVSSGETGGSSVVINDLDPAKHYFLSVLPWSGYSNSGVAVSFDTSGTATVTAHVVANPIPTAQISVFAFEDTQPINGAPDLPEEVGLAGFTVRIYDAAGQYGVAGGQVQYDAFGNPLGTTYNADGSVQTVGSGIILTDADGVAHIRNLAPGKYGVEVTAPDGQGWKQTSTIEGTPINDAWVKANEPSFFQEFGPPGYHVFMGFVKDYSCFTDAAGAPAAWCAASAPAGTGQITGTVVNLHNSRPPDFTMFDGQPITDCWVGLNTGVLGAGSGLVAQPCNPDGTFSIDGVPPGDYQLVVFDDPLFVIIASLNVTVPAGGSGTGDLVALNQVPVFNWFHKHEHLVFFDRNKNGFRDCVTATCNDSLLDDITLHGDQATINLRWRDGRIYQSAPIDNFGELPLDEVFPFFHWLVAEVDYARLRPTGVTVTVDAGGPVAPGEVLTPQPQFCTQGDVDAGFCAAGDLGSPLINPNTGDNLSRTETGPVLLEGFQGFMGQTSVFEWGKGIYDLPGTPGGVTNGGIVGMVMYATTRAEDDPRYAVGEEWEPGIPRIQVNLYGANLDGSIVDANGSGVIEPADVDNYPLGWQDGGAMGPEDVDNNTDANGGQTGVFDNGDALRVTHTDSWDDSKPSGCQGPAYSMDGVTFDCFDGLRNYNQVRPAVFDGGYAFGPAVPGEAPLPAGKYVVEVAVPPGYELIKEEDRNVDIGDAMTPAPLLLPPECVGLPHPVPAYLSMQTDSSGTPYPGIDPADLIAAPFAGESRPLCDRKFARLTEGQNLNVDFFLFTEAPRAAHVVGGILNDLANEFDPNAPTFGEKYAPPWLPVAFKDWTGREITRVYGDEWGKFNAMLPSTYSVHIPMPSGVSPSMITACMNDPGPIANPAYDAVTNPNVPQQILDPNFDSRYSVFCYTFQYMPGATTYLDTPVLAIAAFTGPGAPLDCKQPDLTPLVASVTGPSYAGPYVLPGQQLTIHAVGDMNVRDPFSTTNGATITRHYGFGAGAGTVTVSGVPLTNVSWADDMITGTVPAGTPSGQLVVTTASGVVSPSGATVTVGPLAGGANILTVAPVADPLGTPIQDAIDLANAGDLILVAPGYYNEMPIMYKPVRLQGAGAYATYLSAVKTPAEKLLNWRDKASALYDAGLYDLLPGQEAGAPTGNQNEPILLFDGEGAGISVLAKMGDFAAHPGARVDGFNVSGADNGGGIFVNGYATGLQVSNNAVMANQGQFGGGVRVGHATLVAENPAVPAGLEYSDAVNDGLVIHHNLITENGSIGGAGGGIALYTGASDYRVTENYVCGNFAQVSGGGIGHLGLSDGGLIDHNKILFNQSFDQGLPTHGGGIFIGGQAGLGGAGTPSPGTGSVTINANLIQGNNAGAGDGGGISLLSVNGEDVVARSNPNNWYKVEILNNMVVNNVTGLAGGGVAIQDALQVDIVNNQVVRNDSTATAGAAFAPNSPNQSTPQPAGIVVRANSPELEGAIPLAGRYSQFHTYAKPRIANDIVWQNRSFYWSIVGDPNDPTPATYGLSPNPNGLYQDLAVLPVGTPGGNLAASRCILTDNTGYPGNSSANPQLVFPYFNQDPAQTIIQQETTTTLQAAVAFDEGGNAIDVRYGPLTPFGDYHITSGSPAINWGNGNLARQYPELSVDYDGEPRPNSGPVDAGADEYHP